VKQAMLTHTNGKKKQTYLDWFGQLEVEGTVLDYTTKLNEADENSPSHSDILHFKNHLRLKEN